MQPAQPATDSVVLHVDLRDVVYALADALDLVGVDDVHHGKRVGTMAADCARPLGLGEDDCNFLFDLGLLHDIGVSSTRTHNRLVEEFDWTGSQVHCEHGHALLREFAPLAAMALPVRYHHTRWDRLADAHEVDGPTALKANLIFLTDRVDALAAPHYAGGGILGGAAHIRAQISTHAGTYFAPHLVEAFLHASACEAFWLQLEPRGLGAVLHNMAARRAPYRATLAELQQLARLFARIVDSKSPFTAEHSRGVAQLARYLGERMNLPRAQCEKLEIAGLLHDLGKLRIPDEILDKPGPLDERERQIMHTHSFETFQILRNIRGLEEITPWAAWHHEEPNGSGYPFRLHAADLPLEARILRVADIFQAMVQDRPYRRGLSPDKVLAFFDDLLAQGRVDGDILDVIRADLGSAYASASAVPA
ncbi:MAG: HD domain-containing protein [Rhodocyclaceae bacterium]|nr:HD domain-containing protein [Rhodocyclaceae bacterium]